MATQISDLAARLNEVADLQAEAQAETAANVAALNEEIVNLTAQLGMMSEIPPEAEAALERVMGLAVALANANPPLPEAPL